MSSERSRSADEVFCRHCGEVISVRAEVCPHCGVRNERYDGGSTWGSGRSDTTLGLETNVTAALAYVLSFVSGIVIYVLEDDDFVRFHAAQSIVVLGGLSVATAVTTAVFTAIGVGSVAALLSTVLSLLTVGLWVFLIVTAYRGETRRIPIAADVADQLVDGSVGQRRASSSSGSTDQPPTDDALAALRSRYARGEIGENEFERRLERLLETEDDGRHRRREAPETERSW